MNAFLAGYHPGCTWYPPRELVDGGFAEQCYHGPAGFRTYALAWSEVVGPDLRLEPVELIDLWQRIVLLAELPVRAQGSGVPLTGEYAAVIALHEGTGIREHQYLDHSEALEAVGWGSPAGETSGVSDPQTTSPDTSTPAHRPDTPAPGETAHDPGTPAGDETPHRPDTPAAGDEPG